MYLSFQAVVEPNGLGPAELAAASICSERKPENGRAPLQHAPSYAYIGWACRGLCRAVRRASRRSKALSRSAGTDCPRGYHALAAVAVPPGAIGEEA